MIVIVILVGDSNRLVVVVVVVGDSNSNRLIELQVYDIKGIVK